MRVTGQWSLPKMSPRMPVSRTLSAIASLPEVVDAPACVVLAGIKAVAPPAVDALDVGVCRAPGIGKPGVEQLGKLAALTSSEKPALPRLDLGFLRSISSCATLKSPQVTTEARSRAQVRSKAAIGIVPGHAYIDARELILGVGRVDIHEPKLVELERADAALGCGLGDSSATRPRRRRVAARRRAARAARSWRLKTAVPE